jgi:flagellar biosynthesis component FlhA
VRRFRVTTLTRLLRALLREDVSVRDLRNLMERLLRFDVVPVDQSAYEVFDWRLPVAPGHGWPGPGWPDYLRWVRRESRDLLSARYAEDGAIAVMVLAPELERMAAAADNGRTSVNEAAIEAIRDAVWSTVGGVPTGRKPPLLTQEPVRAAVRRILAPELPDLPVLARSELWPHLEVRQLAVVTPR